MSSESGEGEVTVPEIERVARRLHPSSLVFSFLGHVRRLALPLVLFLFFARGSRWELWLSWLALPAMIYETYRYLSLRYRFGAEELVITKGVVFKSERHVPFARIQNVDSTQNFLHRLAGVAIVRVETAGGSEPEAEFAVLSAGHLEEMRARVFAGRAASAAHSGATLESTATSGAAPPRTLYRTTPVDLALLGLNPGRGLAVIGVLMGVAWELDFFDRDVSFSDLFRIFAAGSADPWVGEVLGSVLLGLTFVALVLGLSLVSTFVRLHDFHLEQRGAEFRVQCGLFTRHTTTIPRRRLQFLVLHEPLILRWLGRASLKVETAGGHDEDEGVALSRQWLAPLVAREQVPSLLREIDARLDLDALPWQPLASGAERRMRRAGLWLALLWTGVALVLAWPWGGLVFPPAYLFLRWHAARDAERTRWARTPYGVFFRRGVLGRKTGMTFFDRVQAVALEESPFDRRHRMASLTVDTAGTGTAGRRIEIPYLERAVAEALHEDWSATAERAPLAW